MRPPPELVPALLDYADGVAGAAGGVRDAAGPLGRWLAAREPRWAYVRGAAGDVRRDGATASRPNAARCSSGGAARAGRGARAACVRT